MLSRGEGAKGAGGITTIRIGWKSGAWTELRVRRPASSEHSGTPLVVLERIRALAPRLPDEHIAVALNADGFTTRMGLPWTPGRVQRLRTNHRIPTGCPVMPQDGHARGDGLVSIGRAAAILGVVPTALDHWRQRGFLPMEQRGAGSPFWVRLTSEEVARLDGTFAAQGYGRWRLREAERVLGMSSEQIGERARQGEVIAYRARVANHWEWRISLAQDDNQAISPSASAD